MLFSLFSLRSLSRRRTTSVLFIVCAEIALTTENHEYSVHCLLRDLCQDGKQRVRCCLLALRSLLKRRTTRALFILCAEIVVTTENQECSVHCLLRPGSLSRRRTTSALFIVCSVIVVKTEDHECSVHCLLCDRCQDGEPQVLCSLCALRSLSRRRTTSVLFIVCAEIALTTENHEYFVHCLLRDLCQDGKQRVRCCLLALRSLSRRRTTSALFIV